MTYLGLTKRLLHLCKRFGAFRPYLFLDLFPDPTPLDLLLHQLAGQQQLDASLGNDFGCVVVCVIDMSTALADKLGLRHPVVFVNVPTLGTFLARVLSGNLDHQGCPIKLSD